MFRATSLRRVALTSRRFNRNNDSLDFERVNGLGVKDERAVVYPVEPMTTQSGANSSFFWRIRFIKHDRWRNPLMGWASGEETTRQTKLFFTNPDDAAEYCESLGVNYEVEALPKQKLEVPASYSDNFIFESENGSETDPFNN
eukprot:TRINITY_DN3726_c0_g1_i1.p1 TRINITY_DN3726_c0_g1~~TRINITY_DN3726_c0_g1_i1.p1  ORF type:complete len:143 (-),score=65.83 TRINITY_DN3726_c0_g1_i1:58-486(-)